MEYFDGHNNVDGDDYELHGKYHYYKPLLTNIHGDCTLSEEQKRRRIEILKTELIPFRHLLDEHHNAEAAELLAVFEKYNGPNGIWQHYAQELDEMKSRIPDAYRYLFRAVGNAAAWRFSRSGNKHFTYGARGSIQYQIRENLEEIPQKDPGASQKPVINLVPFGGMVGIPHHHNMNPDDDPTLKAPLLKILHRLMDEKDAQPFIEEIGEEEIAEQNGRLWRPRCFKFIENGLKSEDSVGYGVTAFFNDMLILFHNCRRDNGRHSEYTKSLNNLEELMKELLREMGSVGEQLLIQYDAIIRQGLESWADPELIYFEPGYNPRLPGYRGEPDEGAVSMSARDQFRLGQERVQQLRSRLAEMASSTSRGAGEYPFEGEAQPGGESRKRPREESVDATEDDLDHGSKRQRSLRSATPGRSNSSPVSPRRAAAKRLRAPAHDAEAGQGQVRRASEPKLLTNAAATSGSPGPSSGATGSASHAVAPPQATPKRAREPADDDSEGDDLEAEDGRGHAGSKRQRLTRETPPASLPIASPQAVPSTPKQATPEPGDLEPGSAQSHVSSLAGPPTPQPAEFPSHYSLPSSEALKFSRNNITMSKITKMGKKRPWLFSYKTAEGTGIYAFVKCPRGNCKHHFSRHPLRGDRAKDHILDCNQQIRDERDMVRQYARQVIKDKDRISDLTVDWARKSNQTLLPQNLKHNHPENFPLSSDDE